MRALFFGLGGVGQRHLRNLLALRPEVEVAAVRKKGRTFEIGNDLAVDETVDIVEKYGITVFDSLDDGLAFEPDIAVVANPTALHVATSLPLVENGIPVFVDKPVASTAEDFDALRRAAARQSVPVMVGYQLRWHPCVVELKRLLDAGRVGRVQSVEVAVHSFMPSWHAYDRPDAFYASMKSLGGGVVLTEIHEIDLLAYFFGRPDTVFACGGRSGPLDIDVEDTITAALRFGGAAPFPASLTLSFVQAPPTRRFVVNGSDGRIVMEIPLMRLRVFDTGGAETERLEVPDFDRNRMFLDEMSHFLDRAADGRPMATSLAEIADGQNTALALLQSLQSGAPVQP